MATRASIRFCFNFRRAEAAWWGTYQQVKSSGAHVLKGERGTHIILFRPIKRTKIDQNGEEKDDSFCVLRTFTVFNTEQTSGLKQYRVGLAQPKEHADERHAPNDTRLRRRKILG